MSFIPKPHEIYRHFKGNLYQVTAVAEHTETGEQLVIYQALYGGFQTYARPLDMFVGRLDREKYPDAAQEFRFELQGPEAGRQRAESEEEDAAGGGGQTAGSGSASAKSASAKAGHTASGKDAPHAPASVGRAAAEEPGGSAPEGRSAGDALKERKAVAEEPAGGVPEGRKAGTEESAGSAPEKGPEDEEPALDPLVLEFLDADSYGQRLNILAALHHRITDEMITTMAIASDIEINDGEIEDRYEALKTCLLTRERYECRRLR